SGFGGRPRHSPAWRHPSARVTGTLRRLRCERVSPRRFLLTGADPAAEPPRGNLCAAPLSKKRSTSSRVSIFLRPHVRFLPRATPGEKEVRPGLCPGPAKGIALGTSQSVVAPSAWPPPPPTPG